MAEHDWRPIPNAPEMDGAQCRRCGLIASNAEIAMTRSTAGREATQRECEDKADG